MYVCMYEARFFPLVAHIFPLNARKARKRAFKGKRCATKGEEYVCKYICMYVRFCGRSSCIHTTPV